MGEWFLRGQKADCAPAGGSMRGQAATVKRSLAGQRPEAFGACTRRGQAAMEYLATYGWAVFAMFVVIAGLVGSGVFGPERFAIEECSIQPNIPCTNYYMYYNTSDRMLYVSIDITNGIGADVLWRNATVSLTDGGQQFSGTVEPSPRYANQGKVSTALITISMPNPMQANVQKKSKVSIDYSVCEGYNGEFDCELKAPPHTTTGRFDAFVRTTG